jgi:hypothetical protein
MKDSHEEFLFEKQALLSWIGTKIDAPVACQTIGEKK